MTSTFVQPDRQPSARGWSVTGVTILLSLAATAAAAPNNNRSVTQGVAKTTIPNLLNCAAQNARASTVGRISSHDGRRWTVPASTAFATGPKALDLYNPCNNATPSGLEAINTGNVPIVEIDADGEVITGYLYADDYFELYINGRLVAVDPVPYTPSNSAIVRFKVKRPITYAVKLVDWEEELGIGTERGRNGSYTQFPGKGGFIARFSDGTVTDASWKAQTFYIAPLNGPGDVVENRGVRDMSKFLQANPNAAKEATCGTLCYALHYRAPTYWYVPAFNDKAWPQAREYPMGEIGANTISAYSAFSDAFSGAQFVWTTNLVFDNLVLMRKTVP